MGLPSPTLLLLLFAIYSPRFLLPGAECSNLCPQQCTCYEHADLVDCRDRGFEHVPRGLPHGTWLLELGRNNLSVIGPRAFKGLWSLRVLVLTSSQIEEIQPQVGTSGWKSRLRNDYKTIRKKTLRDLTCSYMFSTPEAKLGSSSFTIHSSMCVSAF